MLANEKRQTKGLVSGFDTSEWKVGTKLYLSQDKRGELTSKRFGDPIYKIISSGIIELTRKICRIRV